MAMEDPSSKIPQSALPSAMSAFKRAKELRATLEAAEGGKGVVLGMDKVAFSKQYGKSIAKELLEEDAIFTKLIKRIPGVERLVERLGGNTAKVAAEGADIAADVTQQVAQQGAQQAVRSALPITQEAVETVLKGGNAYRELVKLGFNQQTASAISKGTMQYTDDVLKAAIEGGDDALKSLLTSKGVDAVKTAATAVEGAAMQTAGKVAGEVVEAGAKTAAETGAKAVVKEGAEEVVKKSGGIFGKLKGLFGGIKGNFVIAGLFSLIGNTMDLMSGKMNLKQFLALTILDTGVYGGIGVASTALGAAIGTALFPGVGTVLGAVIAGGIGLAIGWGAGMVYEKVLRNPVKGMLGPTGGGQPGYDPNQPLITPGQQGQDPYQYQYQPGLPQVGPNGQVIPQQQGMPPQQGQVPPQGLPQQGQVPQQPVPQGQAPQQPGQPPQPAAPQYQTQPYVSRTDRETFAGADGSFWMAPSPQPAAPAAPAPAAPYGAPAAAPGYSYEQAQADLDRMMQGG